MIHGFNHTSFTVANVDRAVRFWKEALGFRGDPVVERTADWVEKVTGVKGARIRVAHLTGYGHQMEFIEYAKGPRFSVSTTPDQPGTGHVCLEVTDIYGTFDKLKAAGADMLGEITRIVDPGLRPCWAGYIRDPNGIIIELLEIARKQA